MTSEKNARVLIDQLLREAGWVVQGAHSIDLGTGLGIAGIVFERRGRTPSGTGTA